MLTFPAPERANCSNTASSFPTAFASWRNIFTSTGAFTRWRLPPVKGGQERPPQETG